MKLLKHIDSFTNGNSGSVKGTWIHRKEHIDTNRYIDDVKKHPSRLLHIVDFPPIPIAVGSTVYKPYA